MKKVLLIIFFTLCLFFNLDAITLGDADGHNGVTIIDALVIAQYVTGLNPSPFYAGAADVNWDGKIDIIDALLVARYYAFGMTDFTVFAFSQSILTEEDPQVYDLTPDINIRAFNQWSIWGDEVDDYNFDSIQRYHDNGICFIGGGTVSVIFETDFTHPDTFGDMATRDANNDLVPHNEVQDGAYRASLANPHYRKYVIDYCKIQIDGGVDGLFFDEVIAGFSGGEIHNWNGNEGFDDYCITDFNKYLIEKYPNYTKEDWKNNFGMTDSNYIKKEIAPDDLVNNFNYRKYLQDNGWNGNSAETSPLASANPLAKEWGTVTNNRMYRADNTFLGRYTAMYWKEIVNELREYARKKYNKYIFITSNGIFPFVDFNSLGMYVWNPDEETSDGRGADYVPVTGGHLNGSKSLMAVLKRLYNKNHETAGNVPFAIFIDWPTETLNNYNNLPLEEKKDYWQIFGAEAYACGLYPAFHLKDTIGGPTATDAGILDFYKDYKVFYKNNNRIYNHQNYFYSNIPVSVNRDNIEHNVMMNNEGTTYVLHLINHNYNASTSSRIITQENIPVLIELHKSPESVSMISPDFAGQKNLSFEYGNNELTINIDEITYYNVVIIE